MEESHYEGIVGEKSPSRKFAELHHIWCKLETYAKACLQQLRGHVLEVLLLISVDCFGENGRNGRRTPGANCSVGGCGDVHYNPVY